MAETPSVSCSDENSVSDSKEEAENLSTHEEFQKIKQEIVHALDNDQIPLLSTLLSRCLAMNDKIDVDQFLSSKLIPIIRDLKKHDNTEVKTAAREVITKWLESFQALLPQKENVVSKQAPMPIRDSFTNKKRPQTVRVKSTKRRSTGLSEDEASDDEPVIKKPAFSASSKVPPFSVDNVLLSMTNGTVKPQMEQRRFKPIVTSSIPEISNDKTLDKFGRRLIRFADEEGQELARIKHFKADQENTRQAVNIPENSASKTSWKIEAYCHPPAPQPFGEFEAREERRIQKCFKIFAPSGAVLDCPVDIEDGTMSLTSSEEPTSIPLEPISTPF